MTTSKKSEKKKKKKKLTKKTNEKKKVKDTLQIITTTISTMVGTWKIVTGHARINFENRPTCYSSEDDDHDEKRGSGLDLCRRGMTIGSMTMGV